MTPGQIIALVKDVLIVVAVALVFYFVVQYGKDIVKVQDMHAVQKQLLSNAETEARWRQERENVDKNRDEQLAKVAAAIGQQRAPVYVVPRGNGAFMVGATMIESDDSSRITARSVHELLSAAYSLHPAFGDAEILEIGTQVRPAFPDNLPKLRRIGDRLYVNGLYRHGFLLAPALARRVAETVLNNQWYPEVMDEDPRERRFA